MSLERWQNAFREMSDTDLHALTSVAFTDTIREQAAREIERRWQATFEAKP